MACVQVSCSIEDTLYGGRSKFMRLQYIYNSEKLITILVGSRHHSVSYICLLI